LATSIIINLDQLRSGAQYCSDIGKIKTLAYVNKQGFGVMNYVVGIILIKSSF